MKVKWNFAFVTAGNNPAMPGTRGGYLETAEEVEDIAASCGFELTSNYDSKDGEKVRQLVVMEPSDSPRLEKLLEEVENRYGWKPSEWYVVPKEKRGEYFGLRKHVTFTKQEIEDAEYLSFFTAKTIAQYVEPTLEQAEKDLFVTKSYKPKKTVAMGVLTPWMKLALRTDLLRFLENKQMKGLACTEVVGAVDLWKLHSDLILPQSMTPLIDANGHVIAEEKIGERPEQWVSFDGGGYVPDQLRYRRAEIEGMEFDVAMSKEFEGSKPTNADRRIIVSRIFR